MNGKTEINGTSVTALLSGEIDHHNAPQIREAIDECVAFRHPDSLILDFGDVTFMDSSGIWLVMGRYRLIEGKNCSFYIVNLSEHAYRVMQLAGREKIAVLKKKARESVK